MTKKRAITEQLTSCPTLRFSNVKTSLIFQTTETQTWDRQIQYVFSLLNTSFE